MTNTLEQEAESSETSSEQLVECKARQEYRICRKIFPKKDAHIIGSEIYCPDCYALWDEQFDD